MSLPVPVTVIVPELVAICGDGHGRLIRAVMWDTGSDLGEFTGHSRSVNSVDFRPCRPYRLVSSSDDMTVAFYQGPPFKFDHSDPHHKNFVHAVRYLSLHSVI